MSKYDQKPLEGRSQERPPLVRTLHGLVELQQGLLSAYDAVLVTLGDDPARSHLADFRADHLRILRELVRCLDDLGGPPSAPRRPAGAPPAGTIAYSGEGFSPLTVVWSNEDEALRAYEQALDQPAVDEPVRGILDQAVEDARHHWAWMALEVAERPGGKMLH